MLRAAMGYLAAVTIAIIVSLGGIASLLITRRRPSLRPWSWLLLIVTSGGIVSLLLLLAGPVAFWLMANAPD